MKAPTLKAFIPYLIMRPSKWPTSGANITAVDPSPTSWGSTGLVEPLPGEGNLRIDLEGAGLMYCVQFNERILPGKVRDEELSKRVKRLEEAEGRKVGKKEYAQLRDETEIDLLPKAFIRRTLVPVIITGDLMLVCTSSAKRGDGAASIMNMACSDSLQPWKMTTANPVQGGLTTLARDQEYAGDDWNLNPGNSAVLKGDEKKTIRIKDKHVNDSDILALLQKDYEVHELELAYHEDGEPLIDFVVNTNLTFKRVTFLGVKDQGTKDDHFAYAVLFTKQVKALLKVLPEVFGGLAKRPEPEKKTTAFDEDDEL